jgi:hypothetical protein
MNLKEMYETNADFRRYVDRYARHNGISTEEALEHAMVKNYADYLEELEQ